MCKRVSPHLLEKHRPLFSVMHVSGFITLQGAASMGLGSLVDFGGIWEHSNLVEPHLVLCIAPDNLCSLSVFVLYAEMYVGRGCSPSTSI